MAPFFKPGTKYMYWDEAMQQYGYVLTQIAGQSLDDYLKSRILDPIGITQFHWKNDSTGKVLNWTGGIEISASDLARFGLLYLNRGNWNGKQLINAAWVDQATRVQVPATIPNALPTSNRQGPAFMVIIGGRTERGPTVRDSGPTLPREPTVAAGTITMICSSSPLGTWSSSDSAWTNKKMRLLGPSTTNSWGWLARPFSIPWLRAGGCMAVADRDFSRATSQSTDTAPNPFLDFRLQVRFTGPSGQTYKVPGFFDGDGHGRGAGRVWRARFAPDEPGTGLTSAILRGASRCSRFLVGRPAPPT